MATKTSIFALQRDSAMSRRSHELATQQDAAYNAAVELLNRKLDLPLRRNGKNPDCIGRLITLWRQKNPEERNAPYHVHQTGGVQAFWANERLKERRLKRLERIAKAEKKSKEPEARDRRPHRRTLPKRTPTDSRLSLSIPDKRVLRVSKEGLTLTVTDCKLALHLRENKNLRGLDVRTIRLVPVEDYPSSTPAEQRRYCLHVSHWVPDPPKIKEVGIGAPEEVLGVDRGVKTQAMTSSGARIHHEDPERRKRARKRQKSLQGKPANSKRRTKTVAERKKQSHKEEARKIQDLRQQIKEELEPVQHKMVALEQLKPVNMTASAKGTVDSPGKNVARKRGLNRSLREAAIGRLGIIIKEEAAKLGIPTMDVPAAGSSQTCPRCGNRRKENRISQAVFHCQQCGLKDNADWTASTIIRNRGFAKHQQWTTKVTPYKSVAPTGWRDQPSSPKEQFRLLVGLSDYKPKGNATSIVAPTTGQGPWPQAWQSPNKRRAKSPKVQTATATLFQRARSEDVFP